MYKFSSSTHLMKMIQRYLVLEYLFVIKHSTCKPMLIYNLYDSTRDLFRVNVKNRIFNEIIICVVKRFQNVSLTRTINNLHIDVIYLIFCLNVLMFFVKGLQNSVNVYCLFIINCHQLLNQINWVRYFFEMIFFLLFLI